MPKIKVLIAADNEDVRLMLREHIVHMPDMALVGFAGTDAGALDKIAGYTPHVVLLVQADQEEGHIQLAQRIYQGFPGCAVVLISPTVDLASLRAAMRAGIRQVLTTQELDTLPEIIRQATHLERSRTCDTERDPRVISVFGCKGGCGRTSVAVNLAAAFARRSLRTVLVDLSLICGDLTVHLNITAKDSIAELVQERSDFTIEEIRNFTMQHASGMHVLCAPSSPEYAGYVQPKHVELLINQMRPYYDCIVLDLPADFSDCTITALENSDDILLVSRPDLSGLRAAKMTMGVLTALRQHEKVLPIINADAPDMLTRHDFARILDMPVTAVLPEDTKCARLSLQRGEPCVLSMPSAKLAKALMRLARRWTDGPPGRAAK